MKPDYEHALIEIRKRLYERKAVVFVGAGFSKNAVPRTPGQSTFPEWRELTKGLVGHLYPDRADQDSVLQEAGATSAARRLAQEFEAAFGRPALIGFVRDAVRDDEFEPGRLHRELLELPWVDVFTTNYDRLLERAARSLWKQHYDPVYSITDLPLARRPRILKLHGSLPNLDNLVLTEDDYRNYRRKYAPFVATVQAALTENVLCLIGFSGDDPNFLAWSGWLRDELRNAVPKTYFFTGDELKPFQRQLLENRHIVPIPIKQIANTDSYTDAYHWLFERLAQRPEEPTPSWNIGPQDTISQDEESAASEPVSPDPADWIDTAILWRHHRRKYKRWCVLHRAGVERLWLHTRFWIGAIKGTLVEEWPAPLAVFVLREIVWRWSTAMQPLSDDFVSKVLDPQLKRFVEWRSTPTDELCTASGKTKTVELAIGELDDAYHSLLQECLRHAREIGDDVRFRRLLAELTKLHPKPSTGPLDDRQSFVQHQEVLHLLGRLKQEAARQQLRSWDTTASDAVWSVRRAGLCLECGLVSHGTDILETTLESLRSVPVSATLDIHGMSAEGITLYLLWYTRFAEQLAQGPRVATSTSTSDNSDNTNESPDPPPQVLLERLNELAAYGCDPSKHLQWLELATSPEPRATKGTSRQEGFDIATVNRSMSVGEELQRGYAYRGIRFIEDAGLPLQIPGESLTIVAANLFRDATKTIGFFAPHEAVGLVLRSRTKQLVETVVSRECLAHLSDSQVNTLVEAATGALREALGQLGPSPSGRQTTDGFWEKQFQVACEVLGRVAVSLNDQEVSEALREVIDLPHHPNIRSRMFSRKSVATCVRRIAGSSTRVSVEAILPSILETPVQGSPEMPDKLEWYDPLKVLTTFTWKQGTKLAVRHGDQMDAIMTRIGAVEDDERVSLCHRAAYLLKAGLLSSKQKKHFASSLFARCDKHGMPKDTGCYDALVLSLPRMDGADEAAMFRAKHLLTYPASWEDLRRTMVPFRQFLSTPRRNVKWTQVDLTHMLDLAEKWLEAQEPSSQQESSGQQSVNNVFGDTEKKLNDFVDWLATMEDIVLLNRKASTQQRDRADELIAKARELGWCVTQAVATRASIRKVTVDEAVAEIRHRLGDREPLNVHQACSAVVRWCELERTRAFQVPPELLQTLGTLVSLRRHDVLPSLIGASVSVMNQLGQEERMPFFKLIEPGLKDLLSETDYSARQDDPLFTIGMKLRIRVACAQFTSGALDLGLSSDTLDQWRDAIQGDVFADVRRELGG